MTRVKICGLQEAAHVEAAITAGADFIGFMFAPSKRRVTLEQAVALAANIPAQVKKVGVFVNEEMETIQHIAQTVPLDFIQYHGDETQAVIDAVGLPSIKACSVKTRDDVELAAHYNVDYWLFDAPGTDFRGGSGQAFDWSLLEQVRIPRDKIIVAGGLHAENVTQAITQVTPYAVDVSSGVEMNGVKDSARILAFTREAKGAKNQ